VLEMGIINRK